MLLNQLFCSRNIWQVGTRILSRSGGFFGMRLSSNEMQRALHLARYERTRATYQKEPMLSYAITFLVIALVAGVLGFAGISGVAASISKILFLVFLILFVVSLIAGRRPRP